MTACGPEILIDRELSWLEFNRRVLEEAQDPTVALLERVKFLAIFSSNLDEFFMIRVADLKRQLAKAKIAGKAVVGMHYTSVAGPVSVYPQARQFAEDYKKKFGKNPEPFAAQAYDATAIAVKAIEAAAKGGKAPTREAVTAAIRGVRHTGITGSVEFDAKGDPKKALYFVLQVVSDNPEKWGDNKEVKRLVIAAPSK